MPPFSRFYRYCIGLSGFLLIVFAVFLVWKPVSVVAETAVSQPPQQIQFAPNNIQQAQDDTSGIPISDQTCKMCHQDTTSVLELPSGETVHVQVDTAVLENSVHGKDAESPLACFDCHKPINDYQYPHSETTAVDLRTFQIEQSNQCATCHVETHLTLHPDADTENPVICTDCHSGHDVQATETWHTGENSSTCTDCHTANDVDVTPEMVDALIQSGVFTQQQITNDNCVACHSQPGLAMTFPNGDEISVTVDTNELHDSVHGVNNEWNELQCTECHTDTTFPHEPVTALSARQYTLNQNNTCQSCHNKTFGKALSSVHGDALQEGKLEAALCTDCHGAHDTPIPNEPRERINETCRNCHSSIFDEYAESVHGEALIGEGNEDVPSCVNCHGVHDIQSPHTAEFRINSPNLCADCHANEKLMAEYEISTAVFDTYVADFHGTTDLLFQSQGLEGAELNEAVCYDCHGVHNIKAPDDPHAGINANLLETCQQCHPDATENFSASWTSHYEPSLENSTLVYLVELFYSIVIPITIGFFVIVIGIDIYGRIRRRGQKK